MGIQPFKWTWATNIGIEHLVSMQNTNAWCDWYTKLLVSKRNIPTLLPEYGNCTAPMEAIWSVRVFRGEVGVDGRTEFPEKFPVYGRVTGKGHPSWHNPVLGSRSLHLNFRGDCSWQTWACQNQQSFQPHIQVSRKTTGIGLPGVGHMAGRTSISNG